MCAVHAGAPHAPDALGLHARCDAQEAVRIYGKKNLKAIAGYVGTRSATQVPPLSVQFRNLCCR